MRLIARLFLPVFTVWLILFPASSYAAAVSTFRLGSTFYPATAAGVATVGLDIVSLAGRASPWITGLTIGYQVGKYVIEAVKTDGSIQPVNVLPANVVQAPTVGQTWSGWTRDVNGLWQPPVTVAIVILYGIYGPTFSSVDAACSDWYANKLPTTGGYAATGVSGTTCG